MIRKLRRMLILILGPILALQVPHAVVEAHGPIAALIDGMEHGHPHSFDAVENNVLSETAKSQGSHHGATDHSHEPAYAQQATAARLFVTVQVCSGHVPASAMPADLQPIERPPRSA